jgi:hypothetical protein
MPYANDGPMRLGHLSTSARVAAASVTSSAQASNNTPRARKA